MENKRDKQVMVVEYTAIVDKAKAENRSLTADETTKLDSLKAEIQAAEKATAEAVTKQIAEHDSYLRSITAAQTIGAVKADTDANTFLRSITTGGNDVGNHEFIQDVVRQYETASPIFGAHGNVQKRSTGNAFSFSRITSGGTGYVKSEGNAGTEDSTSALHLDEVTFKMYDGQKILVSQETLDDSAADIGQEITTLGLAQSTAKFDVDAVAALEGALVEDTTITPTADTTWSVVDLVDAYFSLPNRNRNGVRYICNPETAAKLVGLMDVEDSVKMAIIGLDKTTLLVDDNVSGDTVILTNPTLALAIGMKTPVRVFVQEISEGRTYEAQPRLAVAVRDATALQAKVLKGSSSDTSESSV